MSDKLIRTHSGRRLLPVVELRLGLLLCAVGLHAWETADRVIYTDLPKHLKDSDDDDKAWIPFWCRRTGCTTRCWSEEVW